MWREEEGTLVRHLSWQRYAGPALHYVPGQEGIDCFLLWGWSAESGPGKGHWRLGSALKLLGEIFHKVSFL